MIMNYECHVIDGVSLIRRTPRRMKNVIVSFWSPDFVNHVLIILKTYLMLNAVNALERIINFMFTF